MPSDSGPVEETQRTREWQQFLDDAVHDLRTPLRGIGTSAELLSRACGERLDDDAKRLLRTILEGVTRMENLSKALAMYSRALQFEWPPSGPIRIESALRSAILELEEPIRQSGATINYSPLPRVSGSHEQITVLFRALLSNALQYSGAEAPVIDISAERSGEEWHIAVRDNGKGIDRKYWDQIFQPFRRLNGGSHSAGAGLGLTICKKIAEAHGGTMWVDSQPGAGSTFFFSIPATE